MQRFICIETSFERKRSASNAQLLMFINYHPNPSSVSIWPFSFKGSLTYHDDDIKWKHFPRYWPFARGIHRSPVNSPHKGQWRGALMFSLICTRMNGWVNTREAGDLRRSRAHYDVTVMHVGPDWLCHHTLCLHINQNKNITQYHGQQKRCFDLPLYHHYMGLPVYSNNTMNINGFCWTNFTSRH